MYLILLDTAIAAIEYQALSPHQKIRDIEDSTRTSVKEACPVDVIPEFCGGKLPRDEDLSRLVAVIPVDCGDS